MKKFQAAFVLLLCFFLVTNILAEDEVVNKDVYLIVDKSKSMAIKINPVKEYINSEIIAGDVLNSGDTLTVIAFYGKAIEVINHKEIVDNNFDLLRGKILTISGDGPYTDIGNAFDKLEKILDSEDIPDGRRKLVMLITDGKQEAPPDSKYFSPDGNYSHKYKDKITETYKREGWKIHIVGIGPNAITSDNEEIKGSYTEISDNPTKEELTEKIDKEKIFAYFDLVDNLELKPIPYNFKSILKIKVKSVTSEIPMSITIKDIKLTSGDIENQKINEKPFIFIIQPGELKEVEIPVVVKNFKSGRYKGEIIFTFHEGASFTPAVKELGFKVKGLLGNYPWLLILLIILILLVIAGIIYGVYLLLQQLGKSTSFTVICDQAEFNKYSFNLRHGKMLFISSRKENLFEFDYNKDEFTFGKITSFKNGIRLYSLDDTMFDEPDKLPKNILNKECRIKKQSGIFVIVKFKSKK